MTDLRLCAVLRVVAEVRADMVTSVDGQPWRHACDRIARGVIAKAVPSGLTDARSAWAQAYREMCEREARG